MKTVLAGPWQSFSCPPSGCCFSEEYRDKQLVAERALSGRAGRKALVLSFTVVTSDINSFLKNGVTQMSQNVLPVQTRHWVFLANIRDHLVKAKVCRL